MKIGIGRCALDFPQDFFPTEGFIKQVHPLHARVFFIDEKKPFALVSIEMTSLADEECARLRKETAILLGIEEESVWIAVTHTFSAPHILPDFAVQTEEEKEHRFILRRTLSDAVRSAVWQAKQEAAESSLILRQGISAIPASRDIELPEGWWIGCGGKGPSDQTLTLLEVREQNRVKALLLHLNVQPSVLDGTGDDAGKCVSGDFTGVACAALEKYYPGATALFMIGAAGDQALGAGVGAGVGASAASMDKDFTKAIVGRLGIRQAAYRLVTREQFLRELREMGNALYNCPCIAVWVPFNEGWGQFDAKKVCARILDTDRSRIIVTEIPYQVNKAAMLEKISGYQDSKALLMQCYYYQGLALMEQGDYEGAVAFFDQAPDLAAAQEAKKECVYRPAVALLEEGKTEEALEMLNTIADYQDAAAKIRDIRIEQAQALTETQDYAGAIGLLETLNANEETEAALSAARLGYAASLIDDGRYEEAIAQLASMDDDESVQDYLNRARYLLALDLRAQGDYDSAKTIFEVLGDYEDAPALYNACIYDTALQKAENGEYRAALSLLSDIAGYRDAAQRRKEVAYQAGQSAMAENDLSVAAGYFSQAGNYQNAADLAQRSADQYYAEAYETAVAALERKDYKTVVEALAPLSQEYLTGKYADIPDLYREACYQYANELYSQRKPFEALTYYKQILDYKDVSDVRLSRMVYRLMGFWDTGKGVTMEFREDGSCTIEGEDYYYFAPNIYAINIGDDPDDLSYTYEIVSYGANYLTLRHAKTKTLYRMTRAGE